MCGSNLANDTTISANHAVFKAPAIKYYRAKWGVAHHNRETHPRRLYTTAEEEEKKRRGGGKGSRVHNRRIISLPPTQMDSRTTWMTKPNTKTSIAFFFPLPFLHMAEREREIKK